MSCAAWTRASCVTKRIAYERRRLLGLARVSRRRTQRIRVRAGHRDVTRACGAHAHPFSRSSSGHSSSRGKAPRSMRSLPCCRGAWSISQPAWLSRPPGSPSTKNSRWLIRSFLPRRARKMRSFGLRMPTSADSRASSTEHRTLRTRLVSERGSRGAHEALASRVSQQQLPERRQLSGGVEGRRFRRRRTGRTQGGCE